MLYRIGVRISANRLASARQRALSGFNKGAKLSRRAGPLRILEAAGREIDVDDDDFRRQQNAEAEPRDRYAARRM